MELFQNLSLGKFTRSIGLPAAVTTAIMKARDTVPLDVKFHDGSALVDMGVGLDLVFVVKDGFADDSGTLALVFVWTEIAPGHYRANLSLNTAELIAAIGDDAKLTAYGELSWSSDAGDTWASSATLSVTVQNDVYKGVEGTPLELPGPIDWLGERVMIRTAAQGAPLVNSVLLDSTDVRVDGKTLLYAGLASPTVRIWTESGLLAGYASVLHLRTTDSPEVVLELPGAAVWANYGPSGPAFEPWVDTPLVAFSGDAIEDVGLLDSGGTVPGEFLGQFCRVGDSSPYEWYQWDGTAWRVSVSSYSGTGVVQVEQIIQCSQAYYDALVIAVTVDPNTLYVIV